MSGHEASVNSVVFDNEGAKLYSGDERGIIRVWSTIQEGWSCAKVIDIFKGVPINGLRMHPQNRRLLVHFGLDGLHTLDVRLYRILTSYHLGNAPRVHLPVPSHSHRRGHDSSPALPSPTRTLVRPTYTPCGTSVLSGTSDGRVAVWDTDSGNVSSVFSTSTTPSWTSQDHRTVDVSFHPHDHIVSFATFGEAAHVSLWTWDATTAKDTHLLTSHENIFATTELVEEKFVSRKKEVAAMVRAVKQSIHNLAFGYPEDEEDEVDGSNDQSLGREEEGSYREVDIDRNDLGASHGSILVALNDDREHQLADAHESIPTRKKKKSGGKKKPRQKQSVELGMDDPSSSPVTAVATPLRGRSRRRAEERARDAVEGL
ncbi:Jouberin [Thoreauomyces humboldtii]|nr:Jouberin [Thoreauomyces humboldtii]